MVEYERNWKKHYNEMFKRQIASKVFELLKLEKSSDFISKVLNAPPYIVRDLEEEYEKELMQWVDSGIEEIGDFLESY